jgi:hypothetical protein
MNALSEAHERLKFVEQEFNKVNGQLEEEKKNPLADVSKLSELYNLLVTLVKERRARRAILDREIDRLVN